MKRERGQALPLVMIAVVIGALVIPPFLSHTGTSLIGSRKYAQAIHTQYASDSGAEHAIWNLTNGERVGEHRFACDAPTALAFDAAGQTLYAGSTSGRVARLVTEPVD